MNPLTLVRVRISLYVLWAISNAWTISMAGVKWDSMGWEEQSCLIDGIVSSIANVLMAYFDKSLWRYDESKKNGVASVIKPVDIAKP